MTTHILFDIDNTLYSSSYGLEEQVSRRIMQYMAKYYGISVEEAKAAREKRKADYGTTLEWLIAEKGFTDIEDYYLFIHPENEADTLPPDAALRELLKSLPCKLSVMTNAPMEHAVRILSRLGVQDLFAEIFDLRRLKFRGKPGEEAFRQVLDTLEAEAGEVLFVDDVPRYIEGFISIGGKGVLFDEKNQHPAYNGVKISSLGEIRGLLESCN